MENETTSIQIGEKTLKELVKLKYELNCKSYDDVLERIFDIIKKFKLSKELDIKEYTG